MYTFFHLINYRDFLSLPRRLFLKKSNFFNISKVLTSYLHILRAAITSLSNKVVTGLLRFDLGKG